MNTHSDTLIKCQSSSIWNLIKIKSNIHYVSTPFCLRHFFSLLALKCVFPKAWNSKNISCCELNRILCFSCVFATSKGRVCIMEFKDLRFVSWLTSFYNFILYFYYYIKSSFALNNLTHISSYILCTSFLCL